MFLRIGKLQVEMPFPSEPKLSARLANELMGEHAGSANSPQ